MRGVDFLFFEELELNAFMEKNTEFFFVSG